MKFFAVLTLIAFAAYLFIGFRLLKEPWQWAVLFIPMAFLFAFPFFRHTNFMANTAFLAMGLLTYLFVFTLFREAVTRFGFQVGTAPVIICAFLAVGVGTLKAIYGIETVNVKVPVKNLSPDLAGLRIVHISDLHIGPTIGKKFVSKIVDRINDLKPDIVAFTGDIGDGPVNDLKEDAGPLSEIRSRLGTFYVPGNHEYYWNGRNWMNLMSSLGMNVVVNSGKVIEEKGNSILVAGVPDPRSGQNWEHARVLNENKETSLKLLLSHRSEIAEGKEAMGYDLTLAGHTHGGQFFPWTLIAWLDHKYFVGLYELESGHIYVSPGTGSWGPLLRLGTTPQIAVLELIRAEN